MLAHPGQLPLYVLTVISQFVPIHNPHGYSHIPQSKKHESELNMMYLTCNVIAKNAGQQPPVSAYLSSDVVDQCVQSVGHFPTTDEFIKYMNTRMIEKAAVFLATPPVASAPPLSELDGGKRTRRKMNKKKRKRSYSRRH
jgi:hypothetical protein